VVRGVTEEKTTSGVGELVRSSSGGVGIIDTTKDPNVGIRGGCAIQRKVGGEVTDHLGYIPHPLTLFFACASTQFRCPVRALRYDNGREFDNSTSCSILSHDI
jgi:hypothetical protein